MKRATNFAGINIVAISSALIGEGVFGKGNIVLSSFGVYTNWAALGNFDAQVVQASGI